MVRDGAILSKKAGVQQFNLLTSKGASAGFWANELRILYFNIFIYACKILILYILMAILGSTK